MNRSTSPPRGLVLILRGLSPAHLGCYGNEWLSTRTIDRLAARGVVFDQQDLEGGLVTGRRFLVYHWRSGGGQNWVGSFVGCVHCLYADREVEGTAMPRNTLHPYTAAHKAHQTRTNGQSQACSAELARRRGVGLAEGFKDSRLFVLGYANPRILNGKL